MKTVNHLTENNLSALRERAKPPSLMQMEERRQEMMRRLHNARAGRRAARGQLIQRAMASL
jgi:hypothetical protein